MAANVGFIGMACTSASSIQVAPTFGKQARLGTDPWSFAAPSADGVPFLLDMATGGEREEKPCSAKSAKCISPYSG